MSAFPKYALQEAVKVAQTIEDTNAGQPLPPVETALAMDFSPRNSQFEQITSASIKYGLTAGSSRADVILITETGSRVVAPTSTEDRAKALLKAALEPETFRRMHEYFKGKKLPESQFLMNTIVREFDVPRAHAEACATIFVENMEFVGLVMARGKDKYLSAQAIPVIADEDIIDGVTDDEADEPEIEFEESSPQVPAPKGTVDLPPVPAPSENNKVFISHGKNIAIVGQLKDLLTFGHFEPVVSVERETTSKPVPDKVMDDMRACSAGIIHVGTERKVLDTEGNEHSMINQNVLIEIGAAMALYGRRFILLTETGTTLPSNLQGLYEVRLEGNGLDHAATMKLLKAFNDFKS